MPILAKVGTFLLSQGWKAATAVVVAVGSVMGSCTAIAYASEEVKKTKAQGGE